MRNINIARILRIIWQKKGISRIEIARELNLDKSTITNIIADLLSKKTVLETDMGESSPLGGRKPIHLCINKDFGAALGFEVQPDKWKAIAVNLDGEILDEYAAAERIAGDNLVAVLDAAIRLMRGRIGTQKRELLGIGVGLSGIVNPKTGEVLLSLPLRIEAPLAVAAPLKKLSPGRFLLDNDANCAAWGELAFHKNPLLTDFFYVLIEFREEELLRGETPGLAAGLGIVMDGKVRYGSHHSAGEFLSVLAKKTAASQFALERDDLLRLNTDREVFLRLAEEVAEHTAFLANVLDVTDVFFSCNNIRFYEDFIPAVEKKLKEKFPNAAGRSCRTRFSSVGDRAVAFGAAGLVLETIFAHPEIPKHGGG